MNTKIRGIIFFGIIIAAITLVIVLQKRSDIPITPFNQKSDQSIQTELTISQDTCAEFSKEWVASVLNKSIIKIKQPTSGVCEYYTNENNFVSLRRNDLSFENHKIGQQKLGRSITTNQTIPINHFLAVQENGLINNIVLEINSNVFLSVDRSSTKAANESELIEFASNVAKKLQQKDNQLQISVTDIPSVPLPQGTDSVSTFLTAISEHRPSDAVSMLSPELVPDESSKQAWAVQFNAFSSLKDITIKPALQEDWTDSHQTYKVTFNASMKSESASASIPYYGWNNGENVRWITLQKLGSLWKISTIGTGP